MTTQPTKEQLQAQLKDKFSEAGHLKYNAECITGQLNKALSDANEIILQIQALEKAPAEEPAKAVEAEVVV